MFYIIDLRGGKWKLLAAVIIVVIGVAFLPRIFYPIKYRELVNHYAKQYDLDSYLVFSIIRTESKFDSRAKSHKGAKGLMQITDQTGEWAAKEIGIEGYTNDKLYNPKVNIQIGCWYIRRLLNQYNDFETSVAAYNAGSGNVSKWLKDKDYSEDGKTLQVIPFKETREYVKKVLRSRNFYKFLYRRIDCNT